MKPLTNWLAAVLCFLPMAALAALKVDAPAPSFSLKNSYGETVNLADFKGKHVVLEWTNHLCPYVKKYYNKGDMQGLQKKFTDKDVVWLSIISSASGKQGFIDGTKANELTKSRNASPSHVLIDASGEVGKLYSAKTTPHMYIIDPEGKLRYAGAIDSIKSARQSDIAKATNYVTEGLTNLMDGKPVKNKNTKP